MTDTVIRPAPALPEDRDVEDLASALDDATARLAELDPLPRQVAKDLLAASDDVHRAALVHLVRGLRDDPRGKELLFGLVDVPAVRMVLLIHGIIRPDLMTEARRVLDTVRPQLQSHGGDVELVRIEEGTAFVRLSGACNGCSMASVTMRNGVEQALTEQLPGVRAVEVLPNEPGPALIPLGEVGMPVRKEAGWCETFALDHFALGTVTPVTLTPERGVPVDAIVVNTGGQLSAFVNSCAHLGMPLDDAEIDEDTGTLTCSWHGFCYDAISGECTTLPGTQLDSLPLRVDNDVVWVRTGS